jgi:predicted DNA-binding transcriptional regulator YafY
MSPREASPLVKDTARRILRYLRAHPWGASKDSLCEETQVSPPSIQRALTWLRDECDSPVEFDRAEGRWILRDSHFSLPLSDPEPEDLNAVLFAEALLGPIADEEITARLRRLAEQMDGEIRDAGGATKAARPGALVATVTTGTRTDPQVLTTLLANVGKGVVRVRYRSPWTADGSSKLHELEPWQLRIHDGGLYLRAWSRSHGQARSFRVAQIERADAVPGAETEAGEARQPLPPPAEIWGHGDPAFGIDHDRPGTARIVVRAPTARWVHQNIWDPGQRDRWIEDMQLLERVLDYRSCRELARRLLSLGDDVMEVEPTELREEMLSHLRGLLSQLDSD